MKIFIFFLFTIKAIFAIELILLPSKDYKVSNEEIFILKAKKLSQGVRIEDDQARELITENRLLSDFHLNQFPLSKEDLYAIKIELEDSLQKKIVQKEMEKLELTEEILLSYYKNNIDEFYKYDTIDFNVYEFDTFDDCLKAYQEMKQGEKKNLIVPSHTEKNTQILNLHPILKNLIHGKAEKDFISTPQYFNGRYIFLKIENYSKQQLTEFKANEKEIIEKLKSMIYNDIRDELLDKLRKKTNE